MHGMKIGEMSPLSPVLDTIPAEILSMETANKTGDEVVDAKTHSKQFAVFIQESNNIHY